MEVVYLASKLGAERVRKEYPQAITDADKARCNKAMLIIHVTGGTEELAREIVERCKPKLLMIGSIGKWNSFPASLETATYFSKASFLFPSEISLGMSILSRAEKLMNSKVLVIGDVSPWLIASKIDLGEFGFEVEKVEIEELGKVNEEVERALKAGGEVKVDLTCPLRLHSAILSKIKNHRGVLIDCFSLLSKFGCTPCISVAMLSARGIIATCEADPLGFLSQALGYVATGLVGTLYNVAEVAEDKVLLAHCTTNITMIDEYEIVTHFESGRPAGVRGRIVEGERVTAFKVSPNLKEMAIGEGEVIKGPEREVCRTQIWVRGVRIPLGFGNHFVLIRGQWRRSLEIAAALFGFKVINVES